MAMVINSNIMSLTAQRNLSNAQSSQNQAMTRLSSGLRINSAKDDAAGLAISQGLSSQVRGLNQAVRNANDGISLAQTAEGALQESTNILQRMRELAVQSANGTYDSGNRQTLNAESKQLKSELDRIAQTTSFNGQNILDGTLGKVDLQVGAYSNQTISMEIGSMSSSSLGGASGDIVSAETTGSAALAGLTAGDLTINDQAVSDLSSVVTGASTVQAGIDQINTDLDGFGAQVSTMVEAKGTSVGDGVLRAGTDTLTLDLTDNYGNASKYVITGTENMNQLVEAINTESGGTISATVDDAGKLVLTAENAQSITVTDSTTADASGIANGATNFSLVINDTSADKRGVKVEVATTDVAAIGLNTQDAAGTVTGMAATATGAADLKAGDLNINGVDIGPIDAGADAASGVTNTIEAINKVSDQTGVVAYQSGSVVALRSSSGEEISIKYGTDATDTEVKAVTGLLERNATSGVGSVASVDISTAAGAQKAIGIIDKALEQINATRGDLGAVNNRLDYTINNLTNVSENAAASRSRIVDADFAAETAALSRAQVLQQAGTAMLSQANAAPQQVLSLLQ
ncbi:flagellar biosynthesis protein FliC [Thiorhodococcus mannitoliphagus]|uniref:Flagellin n=1 Tax=Thiorhodococcus mannitoliphagus TaxID=329406 RepID=A0A6P1E1Y4_9GAMM|nr:flagellin [Thiorhodococcus mannitoliphagus]NEX21715.1 flagellar biosynthesis protein FliC [Thiorhodococcus mannitoliphagus]